MQKFTYWKTEVFDDSVSQDLRQAGDKGWELVTAVRIEKDGQIFWSLIFKQPVAGD